MGGQPRVQSKTWSQNTKAKTKQKKQSKFYLMKLYHKQRKIKTKYSRISDCTSAASLHPGQLFCVLWAGRVRTPASRVPGPFPEPQPWLGHLRTKRRAEQNGLRRLRRWVNLWSAGKQAQRAEISHPQRLSPQGPGGCKTLLQVSQDLN